MLFIIAALVIALGQDVLMYNPNYEIKAICSRSKLAEGPFWDNDAQRLYWVDMRNNNLHAYDPVSGTQVTGHVITEKEPVSMVMRVKDTEDLFVVGIQKSLAVVRWDGLSTKLLTPHFFAHLDDSTPDFRFNDGKADPSNRLWAGSMGAQLSSNPNTFEKDKGKLYLVTPDGKAHVREKGLQISNGIEWSLKADKMYFIDSLAYKVYQYDYNDSDGSISNQQVVFDLAARKMVEAMNSLPDGMTIDTEGMLWVAVYGTQKVIRIDPNTGELLLEIVLPKCLQPTSVAFGDKGLDTLYVTTAKVDWTDDLESLFNQSGRLFKITGLGVTGMPSRFVALDKKIWENLYTQNQ